jgi:hypothetical protein
MIPVRKDHFDKLPIPERDQWRARLRYCGYRGELESAIDEAILRETKAKAPVNGANA